MTVPSANLTGVLLWRRTIVRLPAGIRGTNINQQSDATILGKFIIFKKIIFKKIKS